MSYRFNKDTRNSKNSSFNKRSSNPYRSENDSGESKSSFKNRRTSKNNINRFSKDQINQNPRNNQSKKESEDSNQFISNYAGSSKFNKKTSNCKEICKKTLKY